MTILMTYRHFPVAMGLFIHWALQNLGHRVYSAGPFSNGKIPWNDSFYYPEYIFKPTVRTPDVDMFPMEEALRKLPRKPDLIIQAGDSFWLFGRPPVPHVIIGTDPHVIDYHPRLHWADRFISMQGYCLPNYPRGSLWMPYGFDEHIHRPMEEENRYDVVFCGLQYPQRVDVLTRLKERGLRVFNSLGLIYEEYVKTYNQGHIAFNWSSGEDLPARFWEGLAMRRLVLTNFVPDLDHINLVEGVDYVAFGTVDEAIQKVEYYLSHPNEMETIAYNGCSVVQSHTYTRHVEKMLDDLNL